MKLFLKKLAVFFGITAVLYVLFSLLLLPQLLKATNGPNVQEQLDMSFDNAAKAKDCQMLVLGNSRLYCGINPDAFSLKTYNFSHNNDSYNQLYYKLKWILDKGVRPQIVMLGVDYFQFSIFSDSRNYAYVPLLGKEYLKDYPKKNYFFQNELVLLNPSTVRNMVKGPNYYQWLKPNGQYVRTGIPKETDYIKRNIKRKKVQEKYLDKILEECKNRGIQVFMVMAPMREKERNQYKKEALVEFNKYLNNHLGNGVVYLDYSNDTTYQMNDFIDFSHLNQKSATRFSKSLDRDIMSYIAQHPSLTVKKDMAAQ